MKQCGKDWGNLLSSFNGVLLALKDVQRTAFSKAGSSVGSVLLGTAETYKIIGHFGGDSSGMSCRPNLPPIPVVMFHDVFLDSKLGTQDIYGSGSTV